MSILQATAGNRIQISTIWKAGLLGALAAAAGNMAVLLMYNLVSSAPLQVPTEPGSTMLVSVSLVNVIMASLVPALGAMGLLAILSRFLARPVPIFIGIASVFLLVSFLPVAGVSSGLINKVVLGLMHVVAGVAITWALVRD